MKKIGLAVVTYKRNFGSALQTYATQRSVEKLGFDPECINTDGIMNIIEKRKIKFYLKRVFVPEEFSYLNSYVFSRLKRKKDNDEYSAHMKERAKCYDQFNEKYLKFSEKVNSFEELTRLTKKYDAVIVGSDQLWRPSNIAGGYFTLEPVADSVKRIAYSTSFGVAALPKGIQKHAIDFLKKMDYISVRENSGKRIVKKLIDRDIPVVCDPTMLLTANEWMEIQQEEPIAKGDYILCYLMGTNEQHRAFVKRLRKETGYKVIGLLHGSTYIESDEEWPDEKPYNVGPCEFLNLIRYAKYVCTDSFHCSVFSILNHTPFFVFRRDSDKKTVSSNDRIYTLLKWTGTEERLMNGDEDINESVNRKFDTQRIDEAIAKKRETSMKYLTHTLGKE